VALDNGVKMGMLRQDHYEFDNYSVIETVKMGNEELYAIETEKDALYAKGDMTDAEAERAGNLEIQFGDMDGYTAESRAGELLEGLSVPTALHQKKMKELQGGLKVRVLLAQILYAHPDLLLLDEPTNYLDIESINWLENYITDYEGTVILVSHDRHFLNNVCTHMVDIDRHTATIYTGNYDFFAQASRSAIDAKMNENARQEQRAAELKEFIARFSANASKSKQATSRAKMLEKMEFEEIAPSTRQFPRFALKPNKELGKDLVEVDSLSKGFEGPLLKDINFKLAGGEKLAIIGPNGVGKTTLLRCLLKGFDDSELESALKVSGHGLSADQGKVVWGKSAQINYMPQDTAEELTQDLGMIQWLNQWDPKKEQNEIRSYLGRMLFSGEQQEKSVKVLSGGERQRLWLAKCMLLGGNVLVLDEPSNHMDLESIEALGKALGEFSGSVIVTSHDQDLISHVATRILELRADGSWNDFKGSYADFVQANSSKKGKKKAGV
jgi:ATPase subunit of ABC transporter with duplicated ATPase domains